MENNRQKIVNIVFLGAGVLVAYVAFRLLGIVAGTYDLEAQIPNIDLVLRAVSLLLGLFLFIFLYRTDRYNQYMNEVVVELSRVTWPSNNDTYKSTIVVMIVVLIAGAFLGAMDSLWTWALRAVL